MSATLENGRAVRLASVLQKTAALFGVLWPELLEAEARQWVENLNLRMKTAWNAFQWPQLRHTVQRYFLDGLYQPGNGYPPGATVWDPTTAAWWTAVNNTGDAPGTSADWAAAELPIYRLVPWEDPQGTGEPLGDIYGVYPHDPRRHATRMMEFDLDPAGVALPPTDCHPGPHVWIQHRRLRPEFTAERYDPDRTYYAGQTVYDPEAGECFRARRTTSNPPTQGEPLADAQDVILVTDDGQALVTNTTDWRRLKFPEHLADITARGLYADVLRADGQGDKAAAEEQNFDAALDSEIWRLVHQQRQRPRFQPRIVPAPQRILYLQRPACAPLPN